VAIFDRLDWCVGARGAGEREGKGGKGREGKGREREGKGIIQIEANRT